MKLLITLLLVSLATCIAPIESRASQPESGNLKAGPVALSLLSDGEYFVGTLNHLTTIVEVKGQNNEQHHAPG